MSMHNSQSCCGFREFSGFGGTPKQILTEILTASGSASHILLTDKVNNPSSTKFVDVVRTLGLGEIVQGPVKRNPSTGNDITGWIYTPDYNKVRAFVNNF